MRHATEALHLGFCFDLLSIGAFDRAPFKSNSTRPSLGITQMESLFVGYAHDDGLGNLRTLKL